MVATAGKRVTGGGHYDGEEATGEANTAEMVKPALGPLPFVLMVINMRNVIIRTFTCFYSFNNSTYKRLPRHLSSKFPTRDYTYSYIHTYLKPNKPPHPPPPPTTTTISITITTKISPLPPTAVDESVDTLPYPTAISSHVFFIFFFGFGFEIHLVLCGKFEVD